MTQYSDCVTNYNDGKWHGWNGGECPVHPESMVAVVFCDKLNHLVRSKKSAVSYFWGSASTIVAFRVVKEYREPREWWAVGYYLNDTEAEAIEFRTRSAADAGAHVLEIPIIRVREVLE